MRECGGGAQPVAPGKRGGGASGAASSEREMVGGAVAQLGV
jgi:hypothetical protein